MSYYLFLDDNRFPSDVIWNVMSANGTLVPMPTAQNGWTIVRSYEEFVGTITKQGLPKFIAFDHDLHFEHMKDYFEVSKIENRIINPLKLNYSKYRHKTGYHCAYWLSEYCKANNLKVPAFVAHSMNHIGARNITTLLGKFSRICSEFNC